MEPQKIDKIIEQINNIKPILFRLQWDKDHNQLNPGKLPYLESLQKQYNTLLKELEEIKTTKLEE